MKPIPFESRTKNQTERDFCRWCGNDGVVVAAVRPVTQTAWAKTRAEKKTRSEAGATFTPPDGAVYEEMAPCPYCEVGYKLEFQKDSPWFPDGYWRGRDQVDLQPLHGKADERAPASEKDALEFAQRIEAALNRREP